MEAEGVHAGVKRPAFKASPVTVFCVASVIPLPVLNSCSATHPRHLEQHPVLSGC